MTGADTLAQWWVDIQIERQHRGGGRCIECAPRGGCMRLLGAVRRRVDRMESTGGIRHGLGRLM
ncbi:hypothetical protein ACQEVC_16855 [Plantactinospora sp. CA-294935]|uniref:hypothetical protein n=1 Tax=Plantactinospora sp. CA-294935 TaxID=3240012 RepID=UPI003D903C50